MDVWGLVEEVKINYYMTNKIFANRRDVMVLK